MDSGETSSIIGFRTRKWRFLLPIVNLVLAVSLLMIGSRHIDYVSGESHDRSWVPASNEPVPAAIQIAFAINFPAATFANALFRHNQVAARVTFLGAVIVVWFLIGTVIDRPKRRITTRLRIGAIFGLIVSLGGLLISMAAFGLHYYLVPTSGILWSSVFAITFFRAATKREAVRE